jgi:ABC-type dipeptide/oligopeptide/nickel transport system permease component
MTLWPPDWSLIFGILAFVLASLAAQSWREFAVLIALTVGFSFPVKWIGVAAGFAAYADRTLRYPHDGDRTLHFGIQGSATLITSVILAALAMIAWREVMVRRQEKAGNAKKSVE